MTPNPFPPLIRRPVPLGGLEAVVRAGRRRQRFTAAVTGATLAVATALGIAIVPPGDVDRRSIEITSGDDERTATPSARAAISVGRALIPRSGARVADEEPSPRPSAGITTPTHVPAATLSTRPTPSDDSLSAGGSWHKEMTATTEVGYHCGADTAANEWCRVLTLDSRGASQPMQITLWMCRPAGGTSGTLRFAGGQEADIVIARDRAGQQPVWRWSSGRAFAGDGHEVEVGTGLCRRWQTSWNFTDDGGSSLQPGTYWTTAFSLAPGTPAGDATSTDIPPH